MPKNDLQPRDPTSPTSVARPFKTASRPGQLRLQIAKQPVRDVDLTSATLTFGRSQSADVIVDERSVSKLHFSLRAVDGGVEVEDLGSKNGTWYASRPVRRITLRTGDEFWAGGCCIKLLGIENVNVEVSSRSELGELFGESVAMRELFAIIQKMAAMRMDVLIQGETGTGKELTARSLHALSPRNNGPFVVLDCSTLASSLAESAIFGVRRGAFTGANRDRPGPFEKASGGTLFIDEVGELPLEMQARFLRALDRKEVARMGESEEFRTVDVRVLAATNRDLRAEIRAGRFREDLFHRLEIGTLYLPPLRDRGKDVIALAERFLAELELAEPIMIADDARAALLAYDWPGNVRQLRNIITRTAMFCTDNVITVESLHLERRRQGWGQQLTKALDDQWKQLDYESLHKLVDRTFLPAVLQEQGSMRASARHLGITRERLKSRLHAVGLHDSSDSQSGPIAATPGGDL